MRASMLAILSAILVATPALAAERSFPTQAFDRLIVSGAADVTVSRAATRSVVASGAPADLDQLDIRVENGALVIGQKPGTSWTGRKAVSVAVATPALAGATISGAGDLVVDRIDAPFDGRVSGAGNMRLTAVNSPRLALAVSGAGDVRAAGRCEEGRINVSGAGNVRSPDLVCRVLATNVSGTGNVVVGATQTATVRVSGVGNVEITGGARCTTSTTGKGTVRCS